MRWMTDRSRNAPREMRAPTVQRATRPSTLRAARPSVPTAAERHIRFGIVFAGALVWSGGDQVALPLTARLTASDRVFTTCAPEPWR